MRISAARGWFALHVSAVAAACLLLLARGAAKDHGISAPLSLCVALLLLFEGGAYYRYVVLRRRDFDCPVRYGRAVLRWTVAAHAGWIVAIWLLGLAGAVPRLLPLATAAVQLAIAAGLPLVVRLLRRQLSVEDLLYDPRRLALPECETALFRGPAAGRQTAWIVSYTGVSNEPRVIRQARALLDDGWRVVVCGFEGHSPRPREWSYLRLPDSSPFCVELHIALAVLCKAGLLLSAGLGPRWLRAAGALLHQSCTPHWFYIRLCLLKAARANPDLKADLVVANDYYTCDVAYAVARRFAAKFAVDCHEYAIEQNPDPAWQRKFRPYVALVEDRYLRRADAVTTICDGIADLLNKEHELRRPVTVVRSVPKTQVQPFRATEDRIMVLYHGGIWPVRCLHTAIESLPLWRQEFRLLLRGGGDADYIAELRELARRHGVADRMSIAPAVPFDQIVPEANKADIGYFSYANFSRQSEFALPNKFFEYVMAGLALCVLDLTEMGRLVRRYEFGKLIPEHTPEAIAQTINSFTRAEIDRCIAASLRAAQELNWESEQQRLIAAYREALEGTGALADEVRDIATVSAAVGQ